MTKGVEKQGHSTRAEITVSKTIVIGKNLGIGEQISYALDIRYQTGPLRFVKGKCRKHLQKELYGFECGDTVRNKSNTQIT